MKSVQSMRVVVVGPYCPAGRGGEVALGAAAKIRAVLFGLRAMGGLPLLINSGHQTETSCNGRLSVQSRIALEYCPPQFGVRRVGKFIQSFLAPFLGYSFQRRWRPNLIWVYNSYIFEALYVAGARLADAAVPVFLELEDMPLARRRKGLGRLKTWCDSLAFIYLKRCVAGVSIVNQEMRSLLRPFSGFIYFLPVLCVRFDSTVRAVGTGNVNVGYFGGLSKEKGVDKLLRVIARSPVGCVWTIAGSGPLSSDAMDLAQNMPDRVRFLGVVSQQVFEIEYAKVDVLVNLHISLESFGGGVFPFKLLEAVGNGKVILSSVAEGCPDNVSSSIWWLSEDITESCHAALLRIREISWQTMEARIRAKKWVEEQYSATVAISSIVDSIKKR